MASSSGSTASASSSGGVGRGQAILQFLVTHRRLPVTRDALIEAVWPEVDQDGGRRRLHQAVYALRQTLRDAGAGCQHIVCADGSYRLDPMVQVWTDVDEFDRLVALGRELEAEGRPEGAFEAYREAERLYRGDFLDELPFAEWAAGERARLLSSYVELGNRLADLYAERGDHAAAIAVCNRVLTRDSWNEESARRKMRSYAASGNPSLALRAFRSCQDELARELGTAPTPETRALYEEILSGARSTRSELAQVAGVSSAPAAGWSPAPASAGWEAAGAGVSLTSVGSTVMVASRQVRKMNPTRPQQSLELRVMHSSYCLPHSPARRLLPGTSNSNTEVVCLHGSSVCHWHQSPSNPEPHDSNASDTPIWVSHR